MQGSKDIESQLHKKFKQCHGEWFDGRDTNLIDYINLHNELDIFVDWVDQHLVGLKMIRG